MCPLYEYECNNCENEFEQFMRMQDRHAVACPDCYSKDFSMKISKGFTHGDEPSWLNDHVRGSLQDESDMKKRPLTSRSEYKKHLDANDLVERA